MHLHNPAYTRDEGAVPEIRYPVRTSHHPSALTALPSRPPQSPTARDFPSLV
jgi:hypothetical protein